MSYESPFIGLVLYIFCYQAGVQINRRFPYSLCNPLLIATVLFISLLTFFQLDYAVADSGGKAISLFLTPVTAVLAIPMYKQITILKQNLLPILLGCLVGSLAGLLSVFAMARYFQMDWILTASLLPKSITTPIGIELAEMLGGIPAITVFMIVLTGLSGAVFAPFLCKLLHIKNPIAQGISIGTSSHALGTSKAIEMGEVQGAFSSLSIAITALFTILWSVLFMYLGWFGA